MRKGDKPLRSGSKIDLSSILAAAFAVLDEDGFDGLTVRAVADYLKVQPPALYWHVKSRNELLTLMSRTYMDAAAQREVVAADWCAMLKEFARGLREAMLRHRDSARLCLAAEPHGKPSDLVKLRLAPLIADGLDDNLALLYQASIMAYTVGWVGYEQSPAMHEYLAEIIDFETSFETGLEALVMGFEHRRTMLIPMRKEKSRSRELGHKARGKGRRDRHGLEP